MSSDRNIHQKLSAYSLYVACGAMPFSIPVCHAALTLFVILWATEGEWQRKWEIVKGDFIQLVLIAIALTLLVGIAFSNDQNSAWFILEKKIFFFLIPFAIATSGFFNGSLTVRKEIMLVFCLSCFVALVFCYFHAYQQSELFKKGEIGPASISYLSSSEHWKYSALEKQWLFFSYVGLSGAIKMHPTYLAMYCAFCCIVLLHYSFEERQKIWLRIIGVGAIIFFSISIVFLAARIVLMILCLYFAAMLLLQFFARKIELKRTIASLCLLGLVTAGILINPVTRYRQIEEVAASGIHVVPNTNYNNSTGIRMSLWWLSAKAYLNSNLVFGEGTGDVDKAMRAMSKQYNVTNVLNNYDPHNQYLYALLSNGLIGFLLLTSYFGLVLVKALQNRDIIFSSFAVLFMIVCVTESALELQKGIVFFSLFSSCMLYSKRESKTIESTITLTRA